MTDNIKNAGAGLDLTKKEFERACELLPPDFFWGLPVTPRLVLDIAQAALATPQADAAPSDPLRAAVESMVTMLEEGEWAEHASTFKAPGDALSSRLEAAITDLRNEASETRDAAIAAGGAQEPVAQSWIDGVAAELWKTADVSGFDDFKLAVRGFLIATTLPREAATAWQPIETAPKDREIWAFNGEQARMVWSEGPEWALWIWADQLLADADPSPDQPSHWRDLPEPPPPALDLEPEPEHDDKTIDMFAPEA